MSFTPDPPPRLLPSRGGLPGPLSGGDAMINDLTWEGVEGQARTQIPVPEEAVSYYEDFPRYPEGPEHMRTFATDPKQAPVLGRAIEEIRSTLKTSDESALVRQLISFVQSTTYRTGGLLQKTPIETLADGHGDCSDQSVLLASLLHNMGHPCILLHFPPKGGQPGHVAVGVARIDDDPGGLSLSFQGRDYQYVETTDQMRVGETGDLSRSAAHVIPVDPKPALAATLAARSRGGDARLLVRVANLGSEPATGTKVWSALMAGPNEAWDQGERSLGSLDPHEEAVVEFDLDGPRALEELVVDVKAWAENAEVFRAST